jgi:hypothetical protein
MSEKQMDGIDADLSVDAKAQTSIDTMKPDTTWLCPVCGLKRNIGNHKECSKITQLKYQKKRGEI